MFYFGLERQRKKRQIWIFFSWVLSFHFFELFLVVEFKRELQDEVEREEKGENLLDLNDLEARKLMQFRWKIEIPPSSRRLKKVKDRENIGDEFRVNQSWSATCICHIISIRLRSHKSMKSHNHYGDVWSVKK